MGGLLRPPPIKHVTSAPDEDKSWPSIPVFRPDNQNCPTVVSQPFESKSSGMHNAGEVFAFQA
jgi:hypothetical protein